MVQTLSTDSNNDLFLNREGNISVSRDLEAVLQNCEHAVKVRRGELVLDVEGGIPYFQIVFNGIPNPIQFEAAVRSTLLQQDGVIEVTSFTMIQEGNSLQYTAVIRTSFGEGIVNGGV